MRFRALQTVRLVSAPPGLRDRVGEVVTVVEPQRYPDRKGDVVVVSAAGPLLVREEHLAALK
jgi:hypothetical protein